MTIKNRYDIIHKAVTGSGGLRRNCIEPCQIRKEAALRYRSGVGSKLCCAALNEVMGEEYLLLFFIKRGERFNV